MSKIANKQVICNVLIEEANTNKDIVVLCSDSRGSASLNDFVTAHPSQFVEVGIAEQNIVSISAGLASCGKKVFAVSPACFLSTRSTEQAKVDVAYSNTSVTLIGISGGVSYGALGMTHHSSTDIATMATIPNMNMYLPCDRFQTEQLMKNLVKDKRPSYIRVGRNPVDDVYDQGIDFEMDKATTIQEGSDITIIACGEMVKPAKDAGATLKEKGISTRVIDMYCIKPIDKTAIKKACKETKAIITVEEHSVLGGMGAMVSQIVGSTNPIKVVNMALPDSPVVTGKSQEVFDYYGLNEKGIVEKAMELIK